MIETTDVYKRFRIPVVCRGQVIGRFDGLFCSFHQQKKRA